MLTYNTKSLLYTFSHLIITTTCGMDLIIPILIMRKPSWRNSLGHPGERNDRILNSLHPSASHVWAHSRFLRMHYNKHHVPGLWYKWVVLVLTTLLVVLWLSGTGSGLGSVSELPLLTLWFLFLREWSGVEATNKLTEQQSFGWGEV